MSFEKSHSPGVKGEVNLVNGLLAGSLYGLHHMRLKKKKCMPSSCSGFNIKLPLELQIYVGYGEHFQCLNDITKCYAQTDGLMLHSGRQAWFTAMSETFIGTGYCVFFPMTAQELYALSEVS